MKVKRKVRVWKGVNNQYLEPTDPRFSSIIFLNLDRTAPCGRSTPTFAKLKHSKSQKPRSYSDNECERWLFEEKDEEKAVEIDIYVKIKTADSRKGEFDLLKFWDTHHQLSNLIFFAYQYLHIPASSAPSERVFYRASLIVSILRSSLTEENAKLLTLCMWIVTRNLNST